MSKKALIVRSKFFQQEDVVEVNSEQAQELLSGEGVESVALNHKTEAVQKGCASFGGGCVAGDKTKEPDTYGDCFACGEMTEATGRGSFSAGNTTKSTHMYSATYGYKTHSVRDWSFVCGSVNKDKSDALFVVGNGTDNAPENAFCVLENGTAEVTNFNPASDNCVMNRESLKAHALRIISSSSNLEAFVTVISTTRTPISTIARLKSLLVSRGHTTGDRTMACSGSLGGIIITGIIDYDEEGKVRVIYHDAGGNRKNTIVTLTGVGDTVSIA